MKNKNISTLSIPKLSVPPPKGYLLTDHQIDGIQFVLDRDLRNNDCICKKQIYIDLKESLAVSITSAKFCQELSRLINCDRIKGYKFRRGRYGGICRADAFTVRIARDPT